MIKVLSGDERTRRPARRRGSGRPAPGARVADRPTGRSRRKSGGSTSMIRPAGLARQDRASRFGKQALNALSDRR